MGDLKYFLENLPTLEILEETSQVTGGEETAKPMDVLCLAPDVGCPNLDVLCDFWCFKDKDCTAPIHNPKLEVACLSL